MQPPIVHVQVDVLFSAGIFRSSTVGEPGVQGAAVAGTQGVGTPEAAAVSTLQVPNGMMLVNGMWSMMLAAGLDSAVTVGTTTISAEGAVPELHMS